MEIVGASSIAHGISSNRGDMADPDRLVYYRHGEGHVAWIMLTPAQATAAFRFEAEYQSGKAATIAWAGAR